MADVNLMAAHSCDSVMADTDVDRDSVMVDTDSDRDSGMAESNSNEYDSEVELEIATAYVQLCIEYVYRVRAKVCAKVLHEATYVH